MQVQDIPKKDPEPNDDDDDAVDAVGESDSVSNVCVSHTTHV